MSMVKENLAGALLKPINPSASVILGVYTVLWGLWVVNPFWSVFSGAEVFSVMSGLAPEFVWGIIAILCGSLMIYGATKRAFKSLTRGAGVVGIFWFLISLCYFLSDWHSVNGITAVVMAIYAGFVYLNIRVNYKEKGYLPPDFLQ
jgi:hypothetical protein